MGSDLDDFAFFRGKSVAKIPWLPRFSNQHILFWEDMKHSLFFRVTSCALLTKQPLHYSIAVGNQHIRKYTSILQQMSATDQNDNEATPSIDIPAARETSPEDDGNSGNTASLDFSQGYTSSWAIGKLRSVLQLMASPLTDETGSTRSVIAGLATIAIAGTFVGLVAPANDALSPSYRKISASLGYIYFMAWR